ncbi:unnamed protein product [Rodentolepis nana]|uniref:Cleft lip and palate associated transmembrane protein 1 n=1 Tax=Rodentolepis nana TaxID=102285 RepID=A0A0R3TAB8_RODNA|nr:unnamed protein product [Rodentolepis nana]
MAGEVANGAPNNAVEGGAQEGAQFRMNKWAMLKSFIFRLVFTYFIFSLFRKSPAPAGTPGQAGAPIPASNMIMRDEVLDMYAYLTETPQVRDFNDRSILFWHLKGLKYGNWEDGPAHDGSFTKTAVLKASDNLMHNGSMYIHIYFVLPGFSPDPNSENNYSKQYTFSATKQITRMRKRRLSRKVNLLTGQTETPANLVASKDTPQDVKFLPPVSHWHPNLTINLVDDHTAWVRGAVPSPLNERKSLKTNMYSVSYLDVSFPYSIDIKWYEPTNQYYPVVFINDFWNLNEEYMPINETTPELTFHLTVAPLSLFKWQLYLSQSMRNSWMQGLVGQSEGDQLDDDQDQDMMKKTFLETNPYLLALTIVVSIIHSVFEMLAFKNGNYSNSDLSLLSF